MGPDGQPQTVVAQASVYSGVILVFRENLESVLTWSSGQHVCSLRLLSDD